jgi:hypothetical protein
VREIGLAATLETCLAAEIVFTSAFDSAVAGAGVFCTRGVSSDSGLGVTPALRAGDVVTDATLGAFGITSSSAPDLSGGVEPVAPPPTSRNAS